jgi:GxxExxY protein
LRDPDSELVIGAAIAVHRALGPGLLESVYDSCLRYELRGRGVVFEAGVKVPVRYNGVAMDVHYRLDLLVAGRLVVELKSVDQVHPIHLAQLITYLRLGHFKHGLLINFNVRKLVDGVTRIAA